MITILAATSLAGDIMQFLAKCEGQHPVASVDILPGSHQISKAVKYLMTLSAMAGNVRFDRLDSDVLAHFSVTLGIEHDDSVFKTHTFGQLSCLLKSSKTQGQVIAICSGTLEDWKSLVVKLCSMRITLKERELGNNLMFIFEQSEFSTLWARFGKQMQADKTFTLDYK